MIPIVTHLNSCVFRVWAPEKKTMHLMLESSWAKPAEVPMEKDEDGYFHVETPGVCGGQRYWYKPNGRGKYPDPASCYQPEGVHGPSEIVDHRRFVWHDEEWDGVALESAVIYEIHVGTFTPEGSFEAIIPRLGALAELGVNVIELMPVAQCPGKRNWGYDGTHLFAVQNSYGGPAALKALIDAAHQHGIAVWLDVVYNHLGQEGNYLPQFGPYFSDKYHTPWGKALNFDGAWSDGVRSFVVENILYWAEHYHIDGLRMDAIHEIFDRNAITIWDRIQEEVKVFEATTGRRLILTAESDLNSPRVVQPSAVGGLGFDSQWMDDFHHTLYTLIDESGRAQYQDFGSIRQMAKCYEEGFVHSGDWVQFRHRTHGASSAGVPGHRFIVFNQNHDLPGNRPDGKRLSSLVDRRRLKVAAAAVLLSPYIPMLFMGEEYAEEAPFFFFSDYSEPNVIEAQRKGRQLQFAGFGWPEVAPDGQDPKVFELSKLRWETRDQPAHRDVLDWHRALIQLRRSHPLMSDLSRSGLRADIFGSKGIALTRESADQRRRLLCLFNFSEEAITYSFPDGHADQWKQLLHSGDGAVSEPGDRLLLSPWSVSVYENQVTFSIGTKGHCSNAIERPAILIVAPDL